MFEHNTFAGFAPLVGSRPPLVDPLVPIRQHVAGELGAEVDHTQAEVRVVEMHVVWDAPHRNEVNVFGTL